MEDYDTENTGNKETLADEEESSGFMEGYSDEAKIEECPECGSAIREEKKVVRAIDGEQFCFCSEECASEFEETIGDN